MGIVRLAKSLKLLNSIDEYSSRKMDTDNKISGNRVYMDFVSIVYRTQEQVAKELNYLLFSFLLIINELINKYELESDNFFTMIHKYRESINIHDEILTIIKSNGDLGTKLNKLKTIIDDKFIDDFKKHVKQTDVMNQYVYMDVVNFIVDMLTNKIINVEHILIAFDGIPSYGKIQEQRHRRYMRFAFNEFTKIISSQIEPKSEIKLINVRRLYDKDHFQIDITGAIEYVYNMYHKMHLQKDISQDIKSKTNTEITPVVTVIDRPYGEGEKILIDLLMKDYDKYKDKKTYLFYSPDGDSVILCLHVYIRKKIKTLNVVKTYILDPSKKHNNQSQYVNMTRLYHNIIKTVELYSHLKFSDVEERDTLCNDFILMINFFGNDFVHQIPTMEIGATVIDLLYIYSKYIKSNEKLTKMIDNKVSINYSSFKKFISYLAEFEQYMMLDTYLTDTDKRQQIIRYFGDIFPHRYMIDYRENITKLKNELLKKIKSGYSDYQTLKHMISDILQLLNKTTTVSGKKYGDIFMKLEVKNIDRYVSQILADPDYLSLNNPKFIYNIRPRKNRDMHEIYNKIKIIETELIRNNASIDTTRIHQSNDKSIRDFSFDYDNIRNIIPHDQMPTTYKDIDLFLLEWKSGKWMDILNAYPYNIGYDWKKREVKIIDDEMKRYQYDMLDATDDEMNKIIIDYVKTLSWIVDYYMNTDNYSTEKMISTWSYNYERSPFISHIHQFMHRMSDAELANIMDNVYTKSLVQLHDYLDEKTHKFYIYSHNKSVIDKLPDRYHKYFPDMTNYVKISIKMSKNKSKNKKQHNVFDCRMAPYFSKCIFKGELMSYNELKHMIIPTIMSESEHKRNSKKRRISNDNSSNRHKKNRN